LEGNKEKMEHAEEENWEESKFQEAIYVEATHFTIHSRFAVLEQQAAISLWFRKRHASRDKK